MTKFPYHIISLTLNNEQPPLINIGCGEDITIHELTELVAEVVGFKDSLTFNSSKPDGTMRKIMDVSKMRKIGWTAEMDLRRGIALTKII